ncbi:MAG: hypothetical protein ACP5XB_02605 [Isosphaeraceae bacterium]
MSLLAETSGASARRTARRVYHLLPALTLGFALSSAVVGCGDPDQPRGLTKKAVAFDDVPDALRGAARKAVPKVDFKEAWQNLDSQGKLHSYEIRGRQNSDGKIREVRVSLTGEILESE